MKMGAVIIIICTCFFLACTILAIIIYSRSFGRVEGPLDGHFHSFLTWNEIDHSRYPREEHYFYSGPNKLQGFVYGGANSKGLIVFSHGMGSTPESYFSLVMHFVDRGWRVFTFSNTGVAGSEGKSVRGLYQSLIDLNTALTYIESEITFKGLPVMLMGHSWGGFAACTVLNYNHDIKAVVSFAGFNSGREVLKEKGLRLAGKFYYLLTPQLWAIEKLLFGDTMEMNAVDGINRAGIPVMIVQSSDDQMIPADTTSIYAKRGKITNPNVEIIFLDGEDAAGHTYVFCSKGQRQYRAWAEESWEKYKASHEEPSQLQWALEINYDKALANELNPVLMEKIDSFFEKARR